MSLLERTLSDIARPKWEGTPMFARCWDGLRMMAGDLNQLTREEREAACALLKFLADARVLVVERGQAEVLPLVDDTGEQLDYTLLASALRGVTLPWPITFIDLGGARRSDYIDRDGAAGVLAIDRSYLGLDEDAYCSIRLIPFICVGNSAAAVHGIVAMSEDTGVCVRPLVDLEGHGMADLAEETGQTTVEYAERGVAVLQWLESVNVEIGDQAVSRQVRRAAYRKGREIAKVVRVKIPKSWKASVARTPGHIDFSHRFEVRGHYKFFSESTQLAQSAPDKLSWVPERDGYFRRVWCPPFVKGPVDKPLIPKTRRLEGP